MFGEFFFLGAGAFLGNIVFSVLVLVIAVAVGSNRGRPDPTGQRLRATYLCVILFFSLFTALFAATAAVDALMDMTRSEEEVGGFEDVPSSFGEGGFPGRFERPEPTTEEASGSLVSALFLAGAAAAVLSYHRRQLLELADDDDFVDGPAAPVLSTYLYVSSLVALLALVVGAVMALSGLVQAVSPGTFSADDVDLAREDGARQAFVGGFLALASVAILVFHQREQVLVEAEDDEPTTGDEPIA